MVAAAGIFNVSLEAVSCKFLVDQWNLSMLDYQLNDGSNRDLNPTCSLDLYSHELHSSGRWHLYQDS